MSIRDDIERIIHRAALGAAWSFKTDGSCDQGFYDAADQIIALMAMPEPDKLPLGEPCASCTGHVRQNNAERCSTCRPFESQNYERRIDAA